MPLMEEELSERIIDGCLRVHRTLGPGFLGSLYAEALAVESTQTPLAFGRLEPVVIFYEKTVRSYRQATGLPLPLVINFSKPTLKSAASF